MVQFKFTDDCSDQFYIGKKNRKQKLLKKYIYILPTILHKDYKINPPKGKQEKMHLDVTVE